MAIEPAVFRRVLDQQGLATSRTRSRIERLKVGFTGKPPRRRDARIGNWPSASVVTIRQDSVWGRSSIRRSSAWLSKSSRSSPRKTRITSSTACKVCGRRASREMLRAEVGQGPEHGRAALPSSARTCSVPRKISSWSATRIVSPSQSGTGLEVQPTGRSGRWRVRAGINEVKRAIAVTLDPRTRRTRVSSKRMSSPFARPIWTTPAFRETDWRVRPSAVNSRRGPSRSRSFIGTISGREWSGIALDQPDQIEITDGPSIASRSS